MYLEFLGTLEDRLNHKYDQKEMITQINHKKKIKLLFIELLKKKNNYYR